MGHYNQMVFSGFTNIRLEKISQKVEKVFSSLSLLFCSNTNSHSKFIKKYWDIRWNYDKDEFDSPFGELICYIGVHEKKYHLIISDSSSFKIDYSKKTYKKFCNLCFQLCEILLPDFAIYSEEPVNSIPFIPSDLYRALEILKTHNEYNITGLVMIKKDMIPLQKAQQVVPVNGKLLPEKDFYIYQMYHQR